MRKANLPFALVLICLSGCAPRPSATPPDLEEVRAAIAQRWSDYVAAAYAEDPDALASIWAPDMRMLSDPGGVENLTSARQHRDLAEAAWQVLAVTDLTINPDEVKILGDSIAVEIGTWTEGFLMDGAESSNDFFGAYMAIWQLQRDGRWLMHRFIRNRHDFVNATIEEAVGQAP
jgi:uncharacterized protein (TIGR02246 family)